MSLISIEQIPGTTFHIDQEFIRTSTRKYQALFATSDNEYVVGTTCGFLIHTPHPSDPQQYLNAIDVELVAPQTTNPVNNTSASLWHITIEYGPWNPLELSFNGDPTALPLKFRMDFTVEETPALIDVDGDPICNAAGDPYDPPLMRKVTRATITVERNEAAIAVNINNLIAFGNTTNVAAWNSFGPKTVYLNPFKLPDIKYSQVTNQFYFPMTYVFDINSDTWVKQILNAGLRQLDSAGNLIPIYINGQPASTPVPLNETGQAILIPEFGGGDGGDDGGDTPPDDNSGGESGWPAGGGQPPSGGTGAISGSNLVINAYDLIRTADFTFLNMNTLFTLPTL